jgi:aminopeptidase N
MTFRYLPVLIFLCAALPFASSGQTNEDQCKQVNDIARMEMRRQQAKQMNAFYKKTGSENIDVVYHRCEWTIDPDIRAISGTVTTYFLPKTASATIVFDLDSIMVVDKVSRNGVLLGFTRKNHTVEINPGVALAAGSIDSVQIQYHGIPPNTGFGSFTASYHAGVPVLWTLSEPYGARDWWPCKNTLDDKIDSIDIIITCPKAYKGISNGLRQSEILSTDGNQVTTHWRHRYPIVSYLVCLAVTNYEEFNDSVSLGGTTLPMQTFSYPESATAFQAGSKHTLDAMRLFHHTFGDYPFIKEKYGHTQFSWGGGEEHQTNSFMANVGESLCAHELAHQWFGDKITCGSWEDIWLNEGFATHLASIYMENKYPENIYSTRKSEIDNITSDKSGSVKVSDTNDVGRIFNNRLSYFKGSHLLYMLRLKLGDDVFLKGVRNYINDTTLVYRFAKTNDLKKHLEAAGNVPLDSFFRQWFEGQGYPGYQVEWSQAGARTVKIRVSQSTSHPSVDFFELPVPLRLKNATKDTILVLDNRYNGEVFIRNIGFEPDSVFVDPEYWLISRGNSVAKVNDVEPGQLNLMVYPNPVNDQFTVQLKNFKGGFVRLQLFDMSGKNVYSLQQPLYNGREFLTIPAASLATGKYLLKVADDQGASGVIGLMKK